MIEDLEQIEYRRGMLKKGMVPEDLPVRVWRRAEIPTDVQRAVAEEDLFGLGGVYGDKNAGDPVEYDHLKLVLTDDTIGIQFPVTVEGQLAQSFETDLKQILEDLGLTGRIHVE